MGGSTWIWKSIIALIVIIPTWLSIGYFEKKYHIKAEVNMVWYFTGMTIGSTLAILYFNLAQPSDFKLSIPKLSILLMGLTLGAAANTLLFGSIPQAPNPGLPIGIVNTSSVFVFLISVALAKFIPEYFPLAKIDAWQLLGILLTIAGIGLITLKR